MGKDKDKLEKKRIKAEAKAQKKRLKAGKEPVLAETEAPRTQPPTTKTIVPTEPSEQKERVEKVPWYKNPDWIRAIIGIASLIVAIIILMLNIYK